jgi:hypothetical protein
VGVPIPETADSENDGGCGGGGGDDGGGSGASGGGDFDARTEVDASLERLSRRLHGDSDGGDGSDGGDDASAHIQQAAVGFVREE